MAAISDDVAARLLLEGVLLLRGEARHEHVALLMGLAEADQLLAHLAHFLAVNGRLVTQLLHQLPLRCDIGHGGGRWRVMLWRYSGGTLGSARMS